MPGILDAVHTLRPARSEVVVCGCVLTLCRDRLGQFHRYPMGRRIAAVDPALCDPCVMWSRVGTDRSEALYPKDNLFKGRNIQELSVRDTSVGDTSTLHPLKRVSERSKKQAKSLLG